MKKIVLHWTAGTNQPNTTDYEHYHYIVNGDGLVVMGKYKAEDNENCKDGKYAAHTGGGNTGAIGVSMCGMYVPKNTPIEKTQYPLTKKQCEATFKLIAQLCKVYNIPISPTTVFTHYEFGKTHPNTDSKGKIDIIYLPPYPQIQTSKIGDFIRNKVKWYYENIRFNSN